ncbi:PREDICTED: E3 ubiquitin-protein ligase TRIM39-like [Gekko japonicus]|uniref:E3 ubiquitin-protein ligase TRIM39-like n=1 Tax=Gekko japonicus TaxID=146911 RepID=A0ABM1KZL1_GEKJA|nr:PREDICTED: E3 ubiquitin-protein ligase TRIM39-like [Gekko japonicus]
MAARDPTEELFDETTCLICLDYFKDPVIIECGHNFCRACITQYWGESNRAVSCPYCRETIQQRIVRPNRQLANVVEIVKKHEEGKGEKRKREVCERHQEPLKLFCRDDEVPICVVCDRSKEHRGHNIATVEDVAQEYKEKIKAHVKSLEKDRGNFVDQQVAEDLESQEHLKRLTGEKQKIRSAFQQMHKTLEKDEHFWLAQLDELEMKLLKKQEENFAKLSQEISMLSNLITEIEGTCQQPASEFLQDAKNILKRSEKKQTRRTLTCSPRLEETLEMYIQNNSALEQAMKTCAVTVSLDPDTANPRIILSENRKSVMRGRRAQNLPNNPERFDTMLCVLGCEKFASGRHCWKVEVDVQDQVESWAVGAARESVKRKGKITLCPEEGIWASVGVTLCVAEQAKLAEEEEERQPFCG